MRLLLLSDLHIGREDESQELALLSLVDAIFDRSPNQDFDLVLLAGDLAFSGKEAEYLRLKSLLIDPLRRDPRFDGASFVAVPGNHDVDCDIGYPPTPAALGPRKCQQFFHFDETGRKIRQMRSEAFAAYSAFLQDAIVNGVDPYKEPACLTEVSSSGIGLLVISVVTSFFSSKDLAEEKHQVPAPIHPLRYLLTKHKEHPYKFVLAHHPPNWFDPDSQQHLESLLVEHNAVYLHGHEHRIQADFGRKGLTSLGFGAVYQASLSSAAKPYYRNSFAICEVDSSLHLDVSTWDSENGKWTSDTTLPANFDEPSPRLVGGRLLPLPTTLLKDSSASATARTVNVLPIVPHLTGCYWLAKNPRARWLSILDELGFVEAQSSAFKPPTSGLPDGHLELRIQTRHGSHLFHAVSAHGDVMSYEQVVRLNTLFDTESLSSCTIITLGEFADPAKTLANRLGASKSISAIDGKEFTRLWLLRSTSPLVNFLKSLDVSAVAVTLVITDEGYALVLADQLRHEWFQVIEKDNRILDEASSLVFDLRQSLPILDRLQYQKSTDWFAVDEAIASEEPKTTAFDREAYLANSHQKFDDIRYAPLAAMGFRFRNASLTDLYIQTNADVGGGHKATQGLQRAVSEYIDSLNLDTSLRDQLEAQLRSQYGLGRSSEVGAARQLYHRYGNAVILGDPGSGKTCFVKYEILAYCKPPVDSGSWYEYHLPIYVPLSEASELLKHEDDFFSVCAVLCARRKLTLPRETIITYLSDGRVAFFFDGLDEVSSIKERVYLLSRIENLIEKYSRFGNRFVLTSRPAAVQPVDIPEGFTYLHLKGLSDEEIRILAERVLTSRLGTTERGLLTTEEKQLIEKLFEHVKSTPGLRRISRNPLLLTLLVLIFANTGALSARRHVVYTQAVKTLVSFRHRETMEQVLPEADLRTRLGGLAFAIYQRNISELPTQREVVDTFLEFFPESKEQAKHARPRAREFLRKVAEATGLLVIHSRESEDEDNGNVISFMHHSFLEYYAAVGFLSRDFKREFPAVATHPHWRDVITLMFGLWSEHHDVTDLLIELLDYESDLETITNERLILGIECAEECDVPPEGAQSLLAARIDQSLKEGALRHSDFLREAVAVALDKLVASAGFEMFEDMLVQGVTNSDPAIAAAFMDFIGRLKEPTKFNGKITSVFEKTFVERKDTVIRTAGAGALSRRAEFRSEVVTPQLEKCLKGNVAEKLAAIKAVQAGPELARRFEKQLASLLDDDSALIASSAAQCLLITGLSQEGMESKDVAVRKAVARWQAGQQPLPSERPAIVADEGGVLALLASSDPADIAFGAGLLPLSDMEDIEVHKWLMRTLRTVGNHLTESACLNALRMREGALDLVTLAETDYICSLVGSKHRNVRIGAVRVLGSLPSDEQVVTTLKEYCFVDADAPSKSQVSEETEEGFKALAEHARNDDPLQKTLATAILEALPKPNAQSFGDKVRQERMRVILAACERVGAVVEQPLSDRLLALAKDFRTPSRLRVQTLRVYGRTVRPNVKCVEQLISLLRRDDSVIRDASYAACYSLLGQCRKRVEYVRAVYGMLPSLRDELLASWNRERSRSTDRINASGIEDIRRSLAELESVLISHQEFSERMKLSNDL